MPCRIPPRCETVPPGTKGVEPPAWMLSRPRARILPRETGLEADDDDIKTVHGQEVSTIEEHLLRYYLDHMLSFRNVDLKIFILLIVQNPEQKLFDERQNKKPATDTPPANSNHNTKSNPNPKN